MAPRESETGGVRISRSFKVADKAMDIPVVNDAVSEVTKITAPIAPYLEEGMRIIKDKAGESMSENLKDKVGSCVSSLDSLACNGLDQLTTAVPSLRSATPELVETTKETACTFLDNIQEYLASFKLSQIGIRVVDAYLSVVESPVSLVSSSVSTKVRDIRRHLRAVRRAGAKRAGYPSKEGSLLLQVAKVFRLNILLGLLGMQLVGADEEPLASSPTKAKVRGEVVEEVDEDSEVDPDYVLSSESEDSLEYRSETEVSQEDSQEDVLNVDELEDCPTTPNCAKVEHKISKITEESEEGSSTDDESQDYTEECNTPACAKVEHTNVAEVEEVEIVNVSGEDEVDEDFETVAEDECHTPQCVKDEHEGRRFQEDGTQSSSSSEEE